MKSTNINQYAEISLSNHEQRVERFTKEDRERTTRELSIALATDQNFQKELHEAITEDIKKDAQILSSSAVHAYSTDAFVKLLKKSFPDLFNASVDNAQMLNDMKSNYLEYKRAVKSVDLTNINSPEYWNNVAGIAARTASGIAAAASTAILAANVAITSQSPDHSTAERAQNNLGTAMLTSIAAVAIAYASSKNRELHNSKNKLSNIVANSVITAENDVKKLAGTLNTAGVRPQENSQNNIPVAVAIPIPERRR